MFLFYIIILFRKLLQVHEKIKKLFLKDIELRIFSIKNETENVSVFYNYFHSENFYKFKRLLAKKEFRIFSIKIS